MVAHRPAQPRRRDRYGLLGVVLVDLLLDRVWVEQWPQAAGEVGGQQNTCLNCEKFTTDATFLSELQTQRHRAEQLITERQRAFQARTGQPMSTDNIWLAGRLQEHDALGRIIVRLEQTRLADGTAQAVRGAGVSARTDARAVEAKETRHHAR